ncbi:ndt80 like dna-binding family protein [Ophiocordyceps camponoti-floridani]|uniref:Ndt80 like dna-binding family protein n=1 Tax=Ophiocordyceps camponoti-floridani TaxID=2030778 RepID=A0A8H4VBQ8_9HYPO|nr:ndt80 like dna-binding family protein [Ophiocordyceps camponoti-floridani]
MKKLGIKTTDADVSDQYLGRNLQNLYSPDDTISSTELNTYILSRASWYYRTKCSDDQIFGFFWEDFEDWTATTFERCDRALCSRLRRILRGRGLYVGRRRAPIIETLISFLQAEDMPEWDHEELMAATFTHESAASRLRERIGGDPPLKPAQNTAEHITRPSPTSYPLPLSAAPSARSTHVKREETKGPDTEATTSTPAQNTAGEATDALLAPGPTPMTDILAPGLTTMTGILAPGPTLALLALLPSQPKTKIPEGTVLRIVKPLYGIAEAGGHWFETLPTPSSREAPLGLWGGMRARQGVG